MKRKMMLALCLISLGSLARAEEKIEDTVSDEIIANVGEQENNFSFKNRKRGGMKFEKVDTYDFINESQELGLGGFAEVGVDVYDFENKVKAKSFAEPYIKYEINPIKGSNFYIDGKLGQRYQYNRASDKQDNRESYEIYAGNIYEKGRFFINYKFGVRHQEFDTGDYINKASWDSSQERWVWASPNGSLEKRTEWRFIPRMSYTFNDKWSWFLRGYMAYVDADLSSKQVQGSGNAGGTGGGTGSGSGSGSGTGSGSGSGGGNKPKNIPAPPTNYPKYTGVSSESGYAHRLESGMAYRVNRDFRLSLSAVNANYTGSYSQEEMDWLGIGKAEYRLYNSRKLFSELYMWAFWIPEVTTKSGGKSNDFHNESAYRLGFKNEWNFAEGWSLRPEIFAVYYKKNAGGGTGTGGGTGQGQIAPSRQWEFEMVYRLGLRYYF
ncbi:MAG: hypothetical protein ACRCR2_04560 [Fusobacteriaceae bacterium]